MRITPCHLGSGHIDSDSFVFSFLLTAARSSRLLIDVSPAARLVYFGISLHCETSDLIPLIVKLHVYMLSFHREKRKNKKKKRLYHAHRANFKDQLDFKPPWNIAIFPSFLSALKSGSGKYTPYSVEIIG